MLTSSQGLHSAQVPVVLADLESRKAGLHQQLDEILERKEQVIADRSLSEQEKSEGLVNLDQEVWQVADQLKVLD